LTLRRGLLRLGLGWLLVGVNCAVAADGGSTQAQLTDSSRNPGLQVVGALLDQPESSIDLALAKLRIDRLIDPAIDIDATNARLERMASDVRKRLPPGTSSTARAEALRQYLYVAGPWNDHQPFSYDFDDPFGRDVRNKLLTTYLATRKGNCVSMPLLFVVLGQKLGIDLTVARAPDHVFVKVRDAAGGFINLEATSGGVKTDAAYRRDMPMTDDAVKSGIYLRPLTRKQTVVLMLSTLNEHYAQRGLAHQRLALTELALAQDPKDVVSMLHSSAAYRERLQRRFVDKYPSRSAVPASEQSDLKELEDGVALWRARAEALGWREEQAGSRANYLDVVGRSRTEQERRP